MLHFFLFLIKNDYDASVFLFYLLCFVIFVPDNVY